MFAFAQEARQEHSPLAAFPLSGLLAPLRFVDTGVASQLEEKPGAKTWPGGRKKDELGKEEKVSEILLYCKSQLCIMVL